MSEMAATKEWPDPPLWMSVNISAPIGDRQEEPAPTARVGETLVPVPSEGPVLSTSSLSEAPGGALRRSRVLDAVARRRAMNAVDLAALAVDYDEPRTLLGAGTSGTVHRGLYYGEAVAVKRVRLPAPPRELRADREAVAERRRRLRAFARTMRRYEAVQHPNIVRVHGTSVATDPEALDAIIVLELMYGGSLADSLATLKRTGKPLHVGAIVRIALQVASALRMLHSMNLAWGGVKPENVLLTERVNPATGGLNETAKVCISDLGLANAVSGHLQSDSIADTSTMSNVASFAFKAPESFGGDEGDASPEEEVGKEAQYSDIYSFGSLVYYIATMRLPWEGMNMSTIFQLLVLKKSTPSWPVEGDRDYRPDLPADIIQLVSECWSSDPTSRPSANDLFTRLVQCRNNVDRHVQPIAQRPLDESGDAGVLTNRSSESSASTAVGISPPPGEVFAEEDIHRVNSTRLMNPGYSPLTSPDASRKNSALMSNSLIDPGTTTTASASGAGPSKAPVVASDVADKLKSLTVTSPVTAPPRNPEIESSTEADVVESLFKRSVEENGLRLDIPSQQPKNVDVTNKELHLFESEELSGQPSIDDTQVLIGHDFSEALAKAAYKLQDKQYTSSGAHPESVASGSIDTDRASGVGSAATGGALSSKTMSGFGLFESVGPNASASTVAASMRRKPSSQIHAVIERAGMAFLELQRRDSVKNATPPGQKRREAKSKAEETARKWAEEQAVLKMKRFHERRRFSEALILLNENIEQEEVVKEGLMVIELAATLDGVYVDVCEEGAVEALHGAVSQFGENNVDMCRTFCRIVTALAAWRNAKVNHRMRAAGIPSEIVTLMTHHQGDKLLLTHACTALGGVARSCEESRSAVATLGGPLAVYRAMTRNLATYKDFGLMQAALVAVQSIAHQNEAAANTLVLVCGLDAVALAADVFSGSSLEEQILSAMEAFAFYNDGRRAIITSGGLQALSALMLRRRDVAFLERCCVFIRSVAQWRDTKCETAMLESSIAERAVMTIRLSERHPGDEGGRLAFYASQAVMYLASFGPDTRQRLRMTGGLDAVINLLRTRPGNPRVVTMATNALVELMKLDNASQVEAERLGAVRLLINAAEMYKHESSVFGAVSLTLGYFAGMRQGKIPPSDPLHAYAKFAAKKPKTGARWRRAAPS